MTTIYDVAAKAGVSPATVSRVFNGSKVTPHLAEAVRAAAKELEFVPNRNARRLRRQKSELITMIIPDIENPFFTSMTRAVEDVARKAGYSIMLCNSDEDLEKFDAYLRAVVSEPVAGIICVPPTVDVSLDFAIDRGIPIVTADRTAPRHDIDSVVADSVGGSRQATRELFDAGYRRVACITGEAWVETAQQRAEGWRLGVQDATGKLPDEELLAQAPFTVAGGEEAIHRLLDLPEPPDAVFAANNKLAVGAIRVLMERDLLPPTMGVVSFGGLPLSLWEPRGVIVKHLPSYELGERAASMLLERINGLQGDARHLVLPVLTTHDQAAIEALEQAPAHPHAN